MLRPIASIQIPTGGGDQRVAVVELCAQAGIGEHRALGKDVIGGILWGWIGTHAESTKVLSNGSSHRAAAAVDRLQRRYPNLVLVHGPVHASWLNQIEIYFSIVQRKALTPIDFTGLADVEHRLLAFQRHYEALARPFEWTFPRREPGGLAGQAHARPEPKSVAA